MFLGEYSHTIDDKGRLTIPARFRGELAAGLVVTRGFDQNLVVYPITEWEKLAADIMSRPVSDTSVREFRRRVFSGAIDLEPDRQGRILLPPYLREFAAIQNEVTLVGMYNYIELWQADSWSAVRQDFEASENGDRWANLGF
ncbi:MAG: division/cell wall cluster transcriptional repressor MraZ [Ardenticatenaceae bacterium]|nr:division/cell wall cluster transcriptional repressor MraZ [Ardenticatenaceae bacterium]